MVRAAALHSLQRSHARCGISAGMKHAAPDDALVMEEALAAIRRAMADEEPSERTLAPPSSRQPPEVIPASGHGLLSSEATAAIGSSINALTETVKKHEPTLEELVRETLRPMLKSWLDDNLPGVVERKVQVEIERVIRGR